MRYRINQSMRNNDVLNIYGIMRYEEVTKFNSFITVCYILHRNTGSTFYIIFFFFFAFVIG